MTAGRQVGYAAASIGLGTAGAAALTELFFRIADPDARVAEVSDVTVDARGVARWDGSTNPRFARPTCSAADPSVVAFVGTSILYGAELPTEDTFTPDLARALPGACVSNHAIPGYGQRQVWSTLIDVIEAERPALAWWELWDPTKVMAPLDDGSARHLPGFVVDPYGYPHLPGVPEGPSRALFRWSRAWQYATLTLGERVPDLGKDAAIAELCDTLLPDAARRMAAIGGQLVVVVPTRLDGPIRAGTYPDDDTGRGAGCAAALDLPVVNLADELAGADVASIRLDTCCHLNAAGHDALGAVLIRHTRDRLRR